ncbi:MAG TPA: hypothetical protein VK119_10940 [Bacillota bacterium]|nr:hypothetical protein [Bacillota bacterium]
MELFNKFTEKIIVFFIKFFEKWLPQTSLFIIIISFLIFIINQFLSIENQLFYFQIVEQVLQRNLLNQNKSSLLINISVVLIGFHITVMSVLGTSYSKSVIKLSKENLTKKFIRYVSFSLFYSFVFLLMTIFHDNLNYFGLPMLHFSFFIAVIANSVRFSIITMQIFQKNIELAAEYSEEKQQRDQEFLILIKDIEKHLYNKSQYNTHKLIELKEKIEENKKRESKRNP